MIVEFEGETYELDTARIMLQHAMAIQLYTGLSVGDWQDSLEFPRDEEGNILNPPAQWLKSVAALYWLMLAQNGEKVPIAEVDFDFGGFYSQYVLALAARWKQISEETEAASEADPTGASSSPPGGPPSKAPATPTATTPRPRARRAVTAAATVS